MTDPNYKENLIRFFKSKGFKYKDIDAWMERNQIDKKINDAKADSYRNAYANMVRDNNLLDAGFSLAQLADINPRQASALMSLYPSYGRQWQNTVDLENMKIKNDMLMENFAKKLSMQQQAKIQAMEMKKQALMAYGIPESAATAMAYAGYNPYSGNKGGRSGTAGTGSIKGGSGSSDDKTLNKIDYQLRKIENLINNVESYSQKEGGIKSYNDDEDNHSFEEARVALDELIQKEGLPEDIWGPYYNRLADLGNRLGY